MLLLQQQQHHHHHQPQLTAKKMDCGEPGACGPVTSTRSRTYHMIIFMHHSNVRNMLLLLLHAACCCCCTGSILLPVRDSPALIILGQS
ncbi:GM25235 [Drosophila sechellia]|uniref:GM25235 n=1 Tax=Drosophila sechellia TaxID=7238 RepID=B4HDT0_DROSE|nr:GM25235 [Drosophila sechellia]